MKSLHINKESSAAKAGILEAGCRPVVAAAGPGESPAAERHEPKPYPYHTKESDTEKRLPRILIAEDDGDMRNLMSQLLRRDGYEVVECPNGVGLLDYLSTFLGRSEPETFDLIISDIRMPGLSGLEVVGGLHRRPGFPPTILMTAFGDAEIHAEAEEIGVAAMFDKPFDMQQLLAKVHETVPPPRPTN